MRIGPPKWKGVLGGNGDRGDGLTAAVDRIIHATITIMSVLTIYGGWDR
jgi:hypothetical protein